MRIAAAILLASVSLAAISHPAAAQDSPQAPTQIRVVRYSPLLRTEIVGVIGQPTTITLPAGRERLSRGADRQARQDRRLGRCGLAGGVAGGDQGHAARQQPDPVAGHARRKHDDGDHDVIGGRPEGLSVSAAGEAG